MDFGRTAEDLIIRHNPSWAMGGGTGLHACWLADLAEAGFGDLRTFSFDMAVPFSPEEWVGRMRASNGVGATLPPEQVERFSDDLRRLLADRFPGEVVEVLHRTWAVVGTRVGPAAAG